MAKLGEVCVQITDGSHNPPSGVEQSEYLMECRLSESAMW